MPKQLFLIFISAVLFNSSLHAQSLAVNTDGSSASSSALLDVKSTTRGLLIPRMSKAEKNVITSPATGLLIFQNAPDSIGFHYYNGSDWVWLANSTTPQNWLTTGNSDVTASSYLGTNNNTDLRFAVNTFEQSRISSSSGFWGFGGETNPQYEIDASLNSTGVIPCSRNGIRIKPIGFSSICDNGFFMGLDNVNSIADASIWNYGNNLSGAQSVRIGLNNNEVVRFTPAIAQGLGETDPQYTLDMKVGMAAVYPCIRNGLRINIPGNSNGCERGLFYGYDDNNSLTTASVWNFGDGTSANAFSIRFGLGGNFALGETMRIAANGVGIGSTGPIAKLHIIDVTGSLLPGVMVTSNALPSTTNGFYSGLTSGNVNTGRVWNYQNADIEFGTNDLQRMTISSAGDVGIGIPTPGFLLEVAGTAGKPGGGSWAVASDARMKENISTYTDGLSTLLKINPVKYHYNQMSGYDSKPEYIGVLAQDIKLIAPYMVGSFKKNGEEFYHVDNSAMTYMLINAVKELKQEIEQLRKQVEK